MAICSYSNKTFQLSDKLSIYKVAELKKNLLDFYLAESQKAENFYLDLSSVQLMDSSIIQILLSLRKTILINKGRLLLKKSCPQFIELMNLLGIAEDVFPKAT